MNNLTKILSLFVLSCFLLQVTLITGSLPEVGHETGIGVILDLTSRPGKEAKVAIELAIQEFNGKTSNRWVLYLQNSRNKPFRAANAARQLFDEHKVKAILGAHTMEEVSTISEVISDNESDNEKPLFLPLAGSIPQQETHQWPFIIHTIPMQSTQINAISALLQSLDISQVTLIYETSSSSASLMSHLSQAFRKTGNSKLTHILPLPSGSYSLDDELEVLKTQKHKVFVVHTSFELGVRLFQTAKKMEMTGKGYLWIATSGITDLFHTINSTTISLFKGMVGVKTYFPENTPEFSHFRKRFRQKFDSNYPEEEQDEPGIFAVQGYNAVKLLQKYLTENIQEWKPIHEPTVEIVSVIGKKYNSVYWTEGLGFSDDINGASVYTHSMHNVGRSLWPVQPWYAHRRRRMNQEKTSGKRMKVAVPCTSLFPEFVKCEDSIDGFVIKVFDEMMTKMNQPYDAIPFYGTYDQLMEEVYSEKYDAAAGDVTITEKRQESVIFTQPYTESGLEMIVPVRSGSSNQSWLFLKPFTSGMWRLIVAITIYNGFVIWLIERSHDKNLQGSIITQIGIILWLAFSSLFTLRGDKMHSNLSRMAVVVWLFVALVIIQSYTASLASMLTTPKLEPTITSVDMLKNMNATVGYCNGSSIYDYLKVVLGFEDLKISSYNSTDGYAEALNSREIAAIFLEVPAAKVFLAKYCKSFIRTGETFKVGGFGFAFGSRFSRLLDANKALTNISESRKLKELEDEYLNSGKCVDEEPEENQSLNCHSFWVLFVLTVGTSTIALSIYIIMRIIEFIKFKPKHINLFQLIAFIKVWQRRSRMRRSSTIVPNGEIEIQYTH